MDLNILLNYLISSAQANPVPTAIGGLLLLLLFYKSPKLGLGLMFVTALLIGMIILISNISSLGVAQKARMVTHDHMTND
jgi:hypothetical protein